MNSFNTIAATPYIYQSVDHIKPGYRRCVYKVHSIYYLIKNNHSLIVRILRSQNINKALKSKLE